MTPTYQNGDLLLGYKWGKAKVGDVVVAWVHERTIIKRIKNNDYDEFWLEGDNLAASTDSRQFGGVPPSEVEAVIIAKLGKKG